MSLETKLIILKYLAQGMKFLKDQGIYHLDIKPSNIYLRNDGNPVLLDFGAARQTLASDQPMLKPMYTPGFAPPEQFSDREHLGPWSDIYSTGAAMYACLAGQAPQRSDERLKKDTIEWATKRWAGQYSQHLLETIDWCLQMNALDRPQSVYALQKALITRARHVTPLPPQTFLAKVSVRWRALIGKL